MESQQVRLLQAVKYLLQWLTFLPRRLRKWWLPAVLLLAVSRRFDEGQKANILQGIERLTWLVLLSKADIRTRDARWRRVNESLLAGQAFRVNAAQSSNGAC